MKSPHILFALLFALAGCGDDDFENPAVGDCYALVDELCEYENDCSGESIGRCRRDTREVLDCEVALQVTDDYGTCMRDIRNAQCGVFGGTSLPRSCTGVIITP
jgi:hypothetical protein